MAKKKQASAGAPEWMVTYGDMMSLLLCFFVMLVAMSKISKDEEYIEAVRSIHEAFGFENSLGQIPSLEPSQNSMIQRLEQIIIPKKARQIGETDAEGLEGKEYRVEQVREGLRITGGVLEFNRGSAEARPNTVEVMKQMAREIKGHTMKIELRGHTSLEPLGPGSAFRDHLDLSYARAKAIADLLVKEGIRPQRLRLVACGHTEPTKTQAYQDNEHARNRRVEILVTEALVSELVGDGSDDSQEL